MTSGQPAVSVLMPVYDAEPFLVDAIMSVRAQTLSDWELIAVNDGSLDKSGEMLDSLACEDSRIHVIHQKNLGIHAALNRGLEECRGELVARMDADDISLPARLERQAAFLESHPGIGAVGSWIETFGVNSAVIAYSSDPEENRLSLFLGNVPVAHPSAMIRRRVLQHHGIRYDSRFVEDQGLWASISRVAAISNVPEVLLRYRTHPLQLSHGRRWVATGEFLDLLRRALEQQLQWMGVACSAEELCLHTEVLFGERLDSSTDLEAVEAWLGKLVDANRVTRSYSRVSFDCALLHVWKRTCRRVLGIGPRASIRFLRSPLRGRCAVSRVTVCREAWRMLR